MTPVAGLQEIIESVRRDARSDDPLDQLATASATVMELSDNADAALGFFVDRARSAGHSWVEISAVLGVSKQAVHKRFAATGPKPPMDRFTLRAQKVLGAASGIALEHNHAYIGTEHLLLSLFTEPDAIAAKVLLGHDITADRVAAAVVAVVPDGDERPGADPAYTPRASHVVKGAIDVALDLGHNYVGTEHVLLALYRFPGGVAVKVLTELGLTEEDAKNDVVAALAPYRS